MCANALAHSAAILYCYWGGGGKSITYECCSEVESEHKQSSYRAQPFVFPFTDGPQTNVYSQEYKITKSERVKQDRPLVGVCP